MRELGNLYTAALPAWLAAGFEQAYEENVDLTGKTVLAIGYGSGDAAEAIPLTVCEGWREAASKIGFAHALDNAIELTREQYEQKHDGVEIDVGYVPNGEFVVERVGQRVSGEFQDIGVEYYRYIPDLSAVRERAAE
jgi:hydroxymethylglutaryl-CoA synthase